MNYVNANFNHDICCDSKTINFVDNKKVCSGVRAADWQVKWNDWLIWLDNNKVIKGTPVWLMSRCVCDDEPQSCSSSLFSHSVCITSAVSHTEQALINSREHSCGCFEVLLTLLWCEQRSLLKAGQSVSCVNTFQIKISYINSLCAGFLLLISQESE